MNNPVVSVFFIAIFVILVVICLLLFRKKGDRHKASNAQNYEMGNIAWGMAAQVVVMLLLCIIIGAVFNQNDIPVWPAVVLFITSLIFAVMCRKIAKYKGYNDSLASWVGAILGIIGLIYYAGLPYSPDYVKSVLKRLERTIEKSTGDN